MFFFRMFINFLGYSFLLIILLGTTYYYTSNLYKSYSPISLFLKINDKILVRYLGFDIRLASEYLDIVGHNLSKNT